MCETLQLLPFSGLRPIAMSGLSKMRLGSFSARGPFFPQCQTVANEPDCFEATNRDPTPTARRNLRHAKDC
jgi:hypothetical protein